MPIYPIKNLPSKRLIISLGGSIIFPDRINIEFIKRFRTFILNSIQKGWSFIIITGGGAPTRWYISAATDILDNHLTDDDKDWLGIHSTRYNAHLIRTVFREQAQANIITDPIEDEIDETKKVVVASGWKPGWSTDFVANKLAQLHHTPLVINLSNIKQVYDSDPKVNKNAKPIDQTTWAEFRKIVGEKWTPGMNVPYDPIAAKLAQESDTTVLVMDGHDLDNLAKVLEGKEFTGTMIAN